LSGLPPFGTWAGKALIEDAASQRGFHGVSVILFLSSVLTGGAVLRVGGSVFLGWGHREQEGGKTPQHQEKETKKKYRRTPWVMVVPVGVLLVLALLAGLWPALQRETLRAAARFENPKGYAEVVLDGSAKTLREVRSEPASSGGFFSGVGAAAGAMALALTALFVRRFPQRLRRNAWRVGHPPLAALRTLHSGHVGDYVVWIIVGTAILGGLCAWQLVLRH
jgi:multicomponent Na+:H+ antiporter subunit D